MRRRKKFGEFGSALHLGPDPSSWNERPCRVEGA